MKFYLVNEGANGTPKLFANEVADSCVDLFHVQI